MPCILRKNGEIKMAKTITLKVDDSVGDESSLRKISSKYILG
jgi:hypothetical protein